MLAEGSLVKPMHPRPDPIDSGCPAPLRRTDSSGSAAGARAMPGSWSGPGSCCSSVALPFAPRRRGRAARRRLHPRRPRVGPGEERCSRPSSASRRPPSSSSSTPSTARAGEPGVRGRAAAAIADVPTAPHVAGGPVPRPGPRQVSARRPHRLRHRPARPLARRLARGAAGPCAAALHDRRPACTSRWPAGRRSTATSRPSRRRTCGGASSSPCRWPRSPCCWSSARVVAAACPLVVGGAAVLVALAAIFVLASVTPMSIFVLNLATLLGLGLGVDYSLLHDEPVPRGAGARAAAGRRRVDRPRRRSRRPSGDGRDGRPGGLLQRPDGPARPARPGPVRVHDPALGRASPGRSSWAGGAAALTLLPAILAILGPRLDAPRRVRAGRRPARRARRAPGRGSPGG